MRPFAVVLDGMTVVYSPTSRWQVNVDVPRLDGRMDSYWGWGENIGGDHPERNYVQVQNAMRTHADDFRVDIIFPHVHITAVRGPLVGGGYDVVLKKYCTQFELGTIVTKPTQRKTVPRVLEDG